MSELADAAETGRGPRLPRLRFADGLVLANLLVFAALCFARYLSRFVAYRGAGNLHEFFLYAAFLFAASLVVWISLRGRADLDGSLLGLIQLGLLLHWLGAFVAVDGGRLYDLALVGTIRYDKLVHFVNGGIALVGVLRVTPLSRSRLSPAFVSIAAVAAVLGMASLIELMEFAVMSTIPEAATRIGGPSDSLPDLLAGLSGCLCALPFARPARRRREC